MAEGFYTGLVMMDLRKAFDTIDRPILFGKLKAIGFKGIAINGLSLIQVIERNLSMLITINLIVKK